MALIQSFPMGGGRIILTKQHCRKRVSRSNYNDQRVIRCKSDRCNNGTLSGL